MGTSVVVSSIVSQYPRITAAYVIVGAQKRIQVDVAQFCRITKLNNDTEIRQSS